MVPRSLRWIRCALTAASFLTTGATAGATVLPVPRSLWAGELPSAPGRGTQMLFVRAAFGGYPLSLADARQLIEGRALTPAFDLFCGITPYVDFTNGTVFDSLGREDPTVMCLPFIDPERGMSAAKCRELPTFPRGRYFQNGGAGLRVAGYLAVREAGTYTFAWGHDDGFGMSFGGLPVFEYTDPTGSRVDYRAVRFDRAGLYPFQLDWFDGGGGALIDWYIAPGEHEGERLRDGGFELVSARDLYPSGVLPCTARCEVCPASAPRCDFDRGRCYACASDGDCADCEACDQGRCRPAREVPDAAVAARCTSATDAGGGLTDAPDDRPPPVDGGGLDAATLDGGAPAPSQVGGCRCVVNSRSRRRARVEFALVALALTRRRRAFFSAGRRTP